MKRLLEYAEDGDTVVAWRIDRLGRSLIDVLNTVNGFQQAGVNVQSISDGIDPSTKNGRIMLGMLATLAEYERELIVERVNAGIAVARASGTRFGRPISDPVLIAEQLELARTARAAGKTAAAAAQLVGWSRATLYRHQAQKATVENKPPCHLRRRCGRPARRGGVGVDKGHSRPDHRGARQTRSRRDDQPERAEAPRRPTRLISSNKAGRSQQPSPAPHT